ncbi:MAG: ABC transporter substrate-binding protein [Armatimonadota bacterium]|nr:ABC transporter substrate-binding protein [Armatimonadota bacterium]MDR7463455.1 ABC transporter substrate-binding protein [Armatimonadota bacterium]MDR7469699.1 ABC transporter substrate-binding protein [Armatimonadota bacterium]MDR7473968.1 ABC transporter substrate-binding protein [Armatimonadota bacterium]MDR7540198.1 ABC transporter substrate-binding protein [Armatimonadota bacterium]
MKVIGRILMALSLAVWLMAGSAAAQQTPQPGGTIVMALGADPETLNPGITTGYAVGAVTANIFSGLIRLGPRGEILPQLATSWQVAPDGRTYTFTLRRGVRWHDGRTLSAADVKFSLEEIAGKFHGRFRIAYANVESVSTPNTGTVVIRMKTPFAPFLQMLDTFNAPIMARHLFAGEDIARSPRNLQPVGTGPYVFQSWARGDRVVLVRNPNYWEPVYAERLVFRIIPNAAQRSTALETGEVDVVTDFYLAKTDVPRLRQNKNIRVRFGQPIPALDFMFINTRRGPLANAKVRRALAFAINREQIVAQAMAGIARPARGPFGDGFKYAYTPETDYTRIYAYSPERAAALLQEAGVARDSLRLSMIFDAARAPLAAAAQIIRDNLRQVGITVDLVPLERSVMIDRVYTKGDYDLTVQSFTSNTDPAIGYHRIYLTAPPGQPFVNATGYSNPEVDRLLALAGQTPAVGERAKIYAQVNTILARDLPTLILFDEVGVDAARAHLRNLWQGLDARDAWWLTWVGK